MIDIRQPNITAQTTQEQVLQMRSYLYQLSEQLNWALNTVNGGASGDNVILPQGTAATGGGSVNPAATFAAIKGLIIKSADIVNAYSESIGKNLEGRYVAQSDFGEYREETAALISGNSKNISQMYTNHQTILIDVESLQGDTQNLSGRLDQLDADAKGTEGRLGSLEADTLGLRDATEKLEQNASGLTGTVEQLRKDTENVTETVNGLVAATIATNAYIRTGLLYETSDGIPVYGLEVGQTNNINGQDVFSKFARFSADRLSFYDRNDTEVAYISDYKLYINTAEITGSLQFGNRFRVFYQAGTGLIFKYIGG